MPALPTPSARVVSKRLGDELVLVHLDSNQIYTLNKTGARLWELLADSRDEDTVVARLCAEFDVSIDEASDQVAVLLTRLRQLDLVVP